MSSLDELGREPDERTSVTRPAPDAVVEAVMALRRHGVEVDDSALTKSLYSSDASVYRVAPSAVVFPRAIDDIDAIMAAATAHGISITSRGAGTSIAGNAIGTGLVIDHRRYLNGVLAVDPERNRARVQAGAAHATLQQAAAPHRLRFGPDPSSHSRCTIGGMIGNNACGSRALGYGRTSDNVHGLHVITGTGEHLRLGSLADGSSDGSSVLRELQTTTRNSLATIRTEFGRFGRQVSGYALENLLPENGFDVTKMLVGTEGTLATVVEADVRLVTDAPYKLMVVLGFPDMIAAAAAVPAILPFSPVACEGLDRRITNVVADRSAAVRELPNGSGWLFVELVADEYSALVDMAGAVADASGALDFRVVTSSSQMSALWKIREDGSGLVARTQTGRPAHAGWEDAAVPPEHLASYLTYFEELLTGHGLMGVPYGHFGDGCVHVRIDFDLDDPRGRQRYRDFLDEAAKLVARYGGSMSGEHGDGRARSDLLAHMYSPAAMDVFRKVKWHFDPENILNPGIIVDPVPIEADIRYTKPVPLARSTKFSYPHDPAGLFDAVHRCTGVGRCVAELPAQNSVICPSFQATRNEKDSTRGRARLLQDAVSGKLGPRALQSPEVEEVLDLCLGCKGCKSDCPTGVDMAKYKAEALDARYARRLRPRSHYSLGRLPMWLRVARRVPSLFNSLSGIESLRAPLSWLAGIDARRSIPSVATSTDRDAWKSLVSNEMQEVGQVAAGKEVVLFVDTFSSSFSPQVVTATIYVLKSAGYTVHLPSSEVCCGLTWISTGQLDGARQRLRRTVDALLPFVQRGTLVLGIEPSCTAALRSDLTELIDTSDAAEVSAAVRTLSELLSADADYIPPDLTGTLVTAQPHCHHHAVMGWDTDRALLERAGATVTTVGGCCGLAGNFGAERGHYDVSVAVAETQLLPALRTLSPETVVLADGFSCRTQIDNLHPSTVPLHLAELLARH